MLFSNDCKIGDWPPWLALKIFGWAGGVKLVGNLLGENLYIFVEISFRVLVNSSAPIVDASKS